MLDQGGACFQPRLFSLCQSCFGYPLSIFFIVVNEFCERFSYYGMRGNPFWHPSPPLPPPPTPPPPRPPVSEEPELPLPLLTSLPSPPPLPSAKSTPDPVLPTFPGLERQPGHRHLSHIRRPVLPDAHPRSSHRRLLAGEVQVSHGSSLVNEHANK